MSRKGFVCLVDDGGGSWESREESGEIIYAESDKDAFLAALESTKTETLVPPHFLSIVYLVLLPSIA